MSEPDPFVGQSIEGRYLIEQRIGEGGMGAVYRARHLAMAQPVAIKVLLTDRANDPSMVQRFIREARSSFQIDHPNCVRVNDFGALPDGTLYMVMEYLDGRTVEDELVIDEAMSSQRVRHIGAQTADALSHAHGLGLVHRDLKPANIMLLRRGADFDYVKVFDFGLAKLFDDGAMLTGLSMSPLTQTGIVFGTPEYMSPEQALGGELGPPSDVYTLAVCLYEMLTKRMPFEGATFTEILSKHVKEEPLRPTQKRPDLHIEPALEDILMVCLAKEARHRPSTEALAASLRAVHQAQSGPSSSATITSSETLDLSQAAVQAQQLGASLAGQAPYTGADESLQGGPPRRSYRPFALAMVGIAVVAGAIVALSWKNESPPPSSEAKVAQSPSPPTDADSGPVPPDARRPPVADAAPAPESLPATGQADAAPRPKPTHRPKLSAAGAKHLKAAEEIYRKKGPALTQLGQAMAALKELPRHKRASFLAGDALERSGDKVRACKFFRRSSKRRFRAAGCAP